MEIVGVDENGPHRSSDQYSADCRDADSGDRVLWGEGSADGGTEHEQSEDVGNQGQQVVEDTLGVAWDDTPRVLHKKRSPHGHIPPCVWLLCVWSTVLVEQRHEDEDDQQEEHGANRAHEEGIHAAQWPVALTEDGLGVGSGALWG